MPDSSFSSRTVVITGAGRGLGLGMARRFGRAGAHIVIAEFDAVTGARAAETLRAERLSASFEPLDVRDPAQSLALVDKVVRDRGRLDVWVNNAGISHIGPAETHPREVWDSHIAVMLSGAFYCAQAAGRQMLAQGKGVIVNIASINAHQFIEGRLAYSVAKAGLVALTEALGIEWAKRGVRVVAVSPAVVMTDMVKEVLEKKQGSVDVYEHRTPMRRLGMVDEVAEAVLFLASDEASYITAETLRVDGGWLAYNMF